MREGRGRGVIVSEDSIHVEEREEEETKTWRC